MLIEVRRIEKYPELFPDLYDDLYKALDEVQGNCIIRICRYVIMNNIWNIPIGDWSDDGHGKCDWFTIKSNFTVEQAREAYFKSVEKSGVDICKEVACDYEDNSVSEKFLNAFPEFLEKGLIKHGQEYTEYYIGDSSDLVEMVCLFIQKYNPEFRYEITNFPMLPFCGYDEKGRHIGQIGYGLFY